jgi:hypothetical protein
MIEVAAIVAAQNPEFRRLVPGRISPEKTLIQFRQARQIVPGINPVYAAIEPPDQPAFPNRLKQKDADPAIAFWMPTLSALGSALGSDEPL